MSNNFPYIFPHISKKRQWKEIEFIYCYNIRIVRGNEKEVKEYSESIKAFIEENKHNLVNWNDSTNVNRFYKRVTELNKSSDRSIYWDVKYVSPQNKKELDDLLQITRYPKAIDKWGYIYEGCYNDDKIFIGGRNDMLLNYCKLFPDTSYCSKFRTKTEAEKIDEWAEKVFENPDTLDAYAENWLKSISL